MFLKRKQSDEENYPSYKQQKIGQFFTKLTKEQGVQQATKCLLRSSDMREEQVEEQETNTRKKEASYRAANTRSQRECRERKREREMQSGVITMITTVQDRSPAKG